MLWFSIQRLSILVTIRLVIPAKAGIQKNGVQETGFQPSLE